MLSFCYLGVVLGILTAEQEEKLNINLTNSPNSFKEKVKESKKKKKKKRW